MNIQDMEKHEIVARAFLRLVMGLNEHKFLQQTNGTTKTRKFSSSDYVDFCKAVVEAFKKAKEKESYCTEGNAGYVAKAYKYPATTAQWGVYVDPTSFEVKIKLGRVACNGHVTCAYYGGERQYKSDWRKAREKEANACACG